MTLAMVGGVVRDPQAQPTSDAEMLRMLKTQLYAEAQGVLGEINVIIDALDN